MNNYLSLYKATATALATASLVSCDASFEAAVDEGLFDTPEVSPASPAESLKDISCDYISVDFKKHRLFGQSGKTNHSPLIDVHIPPGEYDIYLHYEDSYHPDQADQPHEIWELLAGYDDTYYSTAKLLDSGVYHSGLYRLVGPTNDLPSHKEMDTTYFENVYIEYPIRYLQAAHAYVSEKYNSIIPVYADFYPSYDYCDYIWDDDYLYSPGGKRKGEKGGKGGKGGKDGKPTKDPVVIKTDIPLGPATELEADIEATAASLEQVD